jgi:hypothetical protein
MRAMRMEVTARQFSRCARGGSLALVLALFAPSAHAEPQASVGLTLGLAGAGGAHKFWQQTDFHLGLHGDVLFGRSNTRDFGFGPYAELLSHAFDDVQFGGGASVLFPLFDPFPLVLSGGAYGRAARAFPAVEPGLAAELFFGSRSYNFDANYVMSGGLIAQLRYGLGASRETSIVIGAQADLALLALPFVFLVNAARGGSSATAPVR